MATTVKAELVVFDSGRTVEAKAADMVNAVDYGASVSGTATANTVAINAAIAAAAGGFVIIPLGVAYTEGSIVFDAGDNTTLLVFGADGVVTFLSASSGQTPVSKSGICIKQQGSNGVILRAVDQGVTAEPLLQIVDCTNGDSAATHTKFVEMDEISAPAAPSANKSRLYTRDNGAGKTQLVVQFPTGAVQVLATEP